MLYNIYISNEQGEPVSGEALFTGASGKASVSVPVDGIDVTEYVANYDNVVVGASGYYDHGVPVSSLHPVTEFVLIKKPNLLLYGMVGAAAVVAIVIMADK